jgi:hypothetical protein
MGMSQKPPGIVICSDQGDDYNVDKFEMPLMLWRLMGDFELGVAFHCFHAPSQSY